MLKLPSHGPFHDEHTSNGQVTEVYRRCKEDGLEAKLKNPKDPTQRHMIRESYEE